jgi:hypothetical protein
LVLAVLLFPDAAGARGRAAEAPRGELEKIASTYRIEVITTDPGFPVATLHGRIAGKAADPEAVREYTCLFAPEFSLYPPDLVRRAQLRRVVLCREPSFAGQRRNAIPDFEHDVLYLDVSRGAYSKPYLRKVIHHEFFHIIDYRDDGSVYRDDRWAALNPAGFRYGNGGRAAQDRRETSVLTTRYPGFLNHYATTAVEEDKAEVFANLLVDPAYVEDRAKKDRVLRAKVERMKELLAQFCPAVNETFWEKVRAAKRADR